MKKTLLLIVISAVSGSVMAQTPASANQQGQDSKNVVANEKTRVVDAKEVVKDSKLFSSQQKQVLENDYKSAKKQYETNLQVLRDNKNLSSEEYTAQKEKINSKYNAYKSRYIEQKNQLNNIVKEARSAASDGVVTADETAKLKARREAAVSKYKQDKKQNIKNKQAQKKP